MGENGANGPATGEHVWGQRNVMKLCQFPEPFPEVISIVFADETLENVALDASSLRRCSVNLPVSEEVAAGLEDNAGVSLNNEQLFVVVHECSGL